MSEIILSIKNVSKVFNNKVVVDDVSFDVLEGQIFGILGPRACGKTALMRIVCGLTKPDKGDVEIYGHSVRKDFENAIVYLGAYIQCPQMYNSMSGLNNLKYYAKMYKGIDVGVINSYVKIVGLKHVINNPIRTYSNEQKQRLGIAQALLHSPKLLVIDEPFRGLDKNGIKEIRSLLQLLCEKENVAILVSSHIIGELEQLCSSICVMNSGKIVDLQTMEQLKDTLGGTKKLRLAVDYPNFAGKVLINEFSYKVQVAGNSILIQTGEESLDKIVERLRSYGISIFKAQLETKSLEQIFLEIIQRKSVNKNWIVG